MKYLRLYAGEDGESHVETMAVGFSMVDYAPPAPAFGLSEPEDATRTMMLRFPAQWDSDLHPTPRRQLFVVLSGRLEGGASDGTTFPLEPGDVLLMEDTTGKGHTARVQGGAEVLGMIVQLE